MNSRLKIISVIGSGSVSYSELCAPLGEWIARQGFHLCTGGGGGVMHSISEAFSIVGGRRGNILGVLPSSGPLDKPDERERYGVPPGYPNPFVEIPIRTHLHLSGEKGQALASRNHIVVLTGDIVLALPGNAGTRSEIRLALEYKKPLLIVQPNLEWKEFGDRAQTAQTVQEARGKLKAIAGGIQ